MRAFLNQLSFLIRRPKKSWKMPIKTSENALLKKSLVLLKVVHLPFLNALLLSCL